MSFLQGLCGKLCDLVGILMPGCKAVNSKDELKVLLFFCLFFLHFIKDNSIYNTHRTHKDIQNTTSTTQGPGVQAERVFYGILIFNEFILKDRKEWFWTTVFAFVEVKGLAKVLVCTTMSQALSGQSCIRTFLNIDLFLTAVVTWNIINSGQQFSPLTQMNSHLCLDQTSSIISKLGPGYNLTFIICICLSYLYFTFIKWLKS